MLHWSPTPCFQECRNREVFIEARLIVVSGLITLPISMKMKRINNLVRAALYVLTYTGLKYCLLGRNTEPLTPLSPVGRPWPLRPSHLKSDTTTDLTPGTWNPCPVEEILKKSAKAFKTNSTSFWHQRHLEYKTALSGLLDCQPHLKSDTTTDLTPRIWSLERLKRLTKHHDTLTTKEICLLYPTTIQYNLDEEVVSGPYQIHNWVHYDAMFRRDFQDSNVGMTVPTVIKDLKGNSPPEVHGLVWKRAFKVEKLRFGQGSDHLNRLLVSET
ncbi:hypothetical protein J6590_051588 [Homalodisca vitripennis]|nr:hypothetical protein J6590_051588 [Homalodisca vitripennis]